jgi:GNAT superfamily N-acetyltransferase
LPARGRLGTIATMSNIRCVPLSADRMADYLRFFDGPAFADNPKWSGCYCYFPIHDPQKIHWHDRQAAENRQSVSDCIRSGQTSGVLAYEGAEVIGWCHAGPWALYPMLHDEPQPDSDTLGVVFCFVVAPAHRGRGVATALLGAACEMLRDQGMTAVQAKPMKSAATAAENHLGPLSMYLAAGFEIVGETDEGDVFVRRPLV